MQLIQQIKAESCISSSKKMIDLTSDAGHGLLLEMSIAELNERLERVRQQNEEETRRRHDEIVRAKAAKEQELVDKLNYISKYRQVKMDLAATESTTAPSSRTKREEEEATAALAPLRAQLDKKRQEREAMAKKLAAPVHSSPSLVNGEAKRTATLYAQQRVTIV